MDHVFPTMLDRPKSRTIVGGLSYFGLAFIVLPIFLFLLMQGSFDNTPVLAGIEIFYHGINALAAVCLFREYLVESFQIFRADLKGTLGVVGIAVGLMMAIFFTLISVANIVQSPLMNFSVTSMLPIAEVDLFSLTCDIVYISPLWGTLGIVLLAPVAISCLFYATSFAPICCERPWLAYIVVALVIAIPRVCNALSFWDGTDELIIYLSQLPFHLLACWTYQKSDTIWAPILTLTAANLLICLLICLMLLLIL